MTRRTLRVNDLLRTEISDLVRQAKDPRLGHLVSITEVETSPDLRHAKVFISIMGTSEEKDEVLRGLSAASGFFRHELGMRLTLRRVPELTFHLDDSIERGSRVLQLLDQLGDSSPREQGEGQGEH